MASRDFPERVFLKHNSKMTGDCCVFKFLRRGVDGALQRGFAVVFLKGKFPLLLRRLQLCWKSTTIPYVIQAVNLSKIIFESL